MKFSLPEGIIIISFSEAFKSPVVYCAVRHVCAVSDSSSVEKLIFISLPKFTVAMQRDTGHEGDAKRQLQSG